MLSKILISFVTLSSVPAFAQSVSMWGTGMYGGTQGCSYQRTAGAGAQSQDDETKEIQQSIQELQKQLKQKKTEKSRLESRDMRDSKKTINGVLSSDYADFVVDHIDAGRACAEYKGVGQEGETIASGDEGGTAVQAPGTEETQPFTADEWNKVCDKSKSGAVSGVVCSVAKFRNEDKGAYTTEDCKKALSEYRKEKLQRDKLTREMASLDKQIQSEKDRLKDAKEDAAQAIADGNKADTEGGICATCAMSGNGYTYQKPQTDWANVAANVGTGLLATYLGYRQQKEVTEANANLGWPTQSYPSWSYGMPFFAQGLYGALGGGTGQGSFGCGGGSNGVGGAFGYPNGMMGMNTMGGGIFTAGMGPWGMNGMNSLGGMGMYGGMGMMMGSMMGYGTMMGYGNMMGMMMGSMSGYGAMMGSMMGMGGIINGGMMMGSMMGSMMGGLMSSGMMMGNMMGYGTMTGSLMGTMMSSGMMMGSLMNSGYMLGTGMIMGSTIGSSAALQYQQQALQMQMQYYQQYQQQQMQRYQSYSSLQSEMYTLMERMQALQYGYGSATGYIGSSTSTGTLINSGYTNYGSLVSSGYTSYGSLVGTTVNATGR